MPTTIKDETAVHGCHYRGDIVVRMRKVLAKPWSGTRSFISLSSPLSTLKDRDEKGGAQICFNI